MLPVVSLSSPVWVGLGRIAIWWMLPCVPMVLLSLPRDIVGVISHQFLPVGLWLRKISWSQLLPGWISWNSVSLGVRLVMLISTAISIWLLLQHPIPTTTLVLLVVPMLGWWVLIQSVWLMRRWSGRLQSSITLVWMPVSSVSVFPWLSMVISRALRIGWFRLLSWLQLVPVVLSSMVVMWRTRVLRLDFHGMTRLART